MLEPKPYPMWRYALEQIKAEHKEGDAIPRKKLFRLLGIEYPTPEMRNDMAEKLKLEFLREFSKLRKAMWDELADLQAGENNYYDWVKVGEQIPRTAADLQHDLRKALLRASCRSAATDVERLGFEQRRQKNDFDAKLSGLRQMLGSRRRLDLGKDDSGEPPAKTA